MITVIFKDIRGTTRSEQFESLEDFRQETIHRHYNSPSHTQYTQTTYPTLEDYIKETGEPIEEMHPRHRPPECVLKRWESGQSATQIWEGESNQYWEEEPLTEWELTKRWLTDDGATYTILGD